MKVFELMKVLSAMPAGSEVMFSPTGTEQNFTVSEAQNDGEENSITWLFGRRAKETE